MLEIPENIQESLKDISEKIGQQKSNYFYEEMINNFNDHGIKSPIEQLLYINLNFLAYKEGIEYNDVEYLWNGTPVVYGLQIMSQIKIGKYIVDFLIGYKNRYDKPQNQVIVECDGHIWHERTKEERKKEKERDRFLTSEGYKILHFTGSEIFNNPYKVSEEIHKFLMENTTW